MIKCFVIDDEKHAIDILEQYIKHTPGLLLVGSSTNPHEALQIINSKQADLIFVGIHTPELTGLDFVKAIKGKTEVIIITSYPQFALQGFELDVVDYLLKPISMPRFSQAVLKAGHFITFSQPSRQSFLNNEEDFLFVKTELKGKLQKINLADIDYVEGMKNYLAIHHGKEKTLVAKTMKDLEDRLPTNKFIRVHKSFIVPIFKVTAIEGNLLRLKNVTSNVVIGDAYKAALMELVKSKII